MPDLVEINVEDDRWAEIGIEHLAENAVLATLETAGVSAKGLEISLLACNDARIADLNSVFRSKRQATNVLAWPAFELASDLPGGEPKLLPEPLHTDLATGLGDIAISFDTCHREAKAQNILLKDHAFHLIVHGSLHLLGYDHERDADATVMEALEVKALASMGIPNPY